MKATIKAVMLATFILTQFCVHAQQMQLVTNPPEGGTFFLQSGGDDSPPYPFDPYAGVMPVYQMSGLSNHYFIDDSAEDFQALQSLQTEMRGGGGMMMNSLEFPGDGEEGGGSGGTNSYAGLTFGTNDLYLTLMPESLTNSGTVVLTIHNPEGETNDLVGWYVWATTNLAYCSDPWALDADNWAWVAATEPGQTNVTVPVLSEVATFYRLAHPTNDCDGDGLPDYYSFVHFGHQRGWESDESLAQDDYDHDGVSNGLEFTNQTDPNSLSFTAHIGYGQTAVTNPTATISILHGSPSYYAVMVDATNFDNPYWQAYTAGPSVPLPNVDGEHLVWIALRGRVNATDWQGFGVTLDRVLPALVITDTTNGPTSKPIIQVTGYTTDTLGAVSCTLSNAAGMKTNITALVTKPDFGMARTNHFQCFDVALMKGANALTVKVSDLAGNMSTTNLSLTFETTNDFTPPSLTVLWPQNGCKLGSDTFTLRAHLDDETASVKARLIGSSGTTNEYTGLVERNGAVWVEGMTLEAGTNWLTLTAIDAATNASTTNLMLIRSSVSVTIDEIPENELNQTTVNLSGTISVTNFEVWANGVQGNITGTNWVATDVPIPPDGSAVIAITVFPIGSSGGSGSGGGSGGGGSGGGSGGSGGGDNDPSEENPSGTNCVDIAIQPEKPADIKLVHGEWEKHDRSFNGYEGENFTTDLTWSWDEAAGGHAEIIWTDWNTNSFLRAGVQYWVGTNGVERFERWTNTSTSVIGTNWENIVALFGPYFSMPGPQAEGHWAHHEEDLFGEIYEAELRADVNMQLNTGGRGSEERESVIRIAAAAQEKLADGTMKDIPPQLTAIPEFGNLNTNSYVDKSKPDNTQMQVTPAMPAGFANFSESPGKYRLEIHGWGGSEDLVGKTKNKVVGQPISLQAVLVSKDGTTPPPLTNVSWVVPATFFVDYIYSTYSGALNTALITTNQDILFYWSDGGTKTVSCTVVGVDAKPSPAVVNFVIARPNATPHVLAITNGVKVDTSWEENKGSPSLYLGYNNGPSFYAWISYTDYDITGTYDWLQTGKIKARAKSISPGKWFKAEGFGLDTAFPYPYYAVRHVVQDAPGISLQSTASNTERSDDYQTYLMYKPPGPDSKYVPLKKIEWMWAGKASNTITNGWVLDPGSTNTITPTPVPAFNHPLWTNNLDIILTNFVEEL